MTNIPSVSVIVPMYKVERYIKSCVDSILAQTFQDFEIILVDDASPDGCVELCQKLYGDNEKVRLVRHEKNLGLGPARNTGMKHAVGKYIYFVDSDDLILSNALEKLFNVAERTNAQVVHAAGRYELEQDEPLPVRKENLKLEWDKFNTEGFLSNNVVYRLEEHWKNYKTWPMAWLCFFRRDFLEKNQLEFLNIISEDETFSFALFCLAERYYIMHEVLYIYRRRSGSIMNTKSTETLTKRINGMMLGSAYIKKFLERLPNFKGRDEFCERMMNEFFDRFVRNNTTPYYEDLIVSPQVNTAVAETLGKVFGDGETFVSFFFNRYHFYRRQSEIFLQQQNQIAAQAVALQQQNQRLGNDILSLFNRMELSPRKIVFINFMGRGYGCNPKYIAEEILRRSLPWDLVWLVKNPAESMPKKIRKVTYGSVDSVYELATAKIIISNTKNLLPFPHKKDGQYFIMTWHGGPAFKAVEKDVEAQLSKSYLNETKANSKLTDLMLVNSQEQFEEFRRAFWYTGEILNVGLPRNDIFFNHDDELVARVRKNLNVPPENKIAMFAPTFRDDRNVTDVYEFDAEKLLDALRHKFGGEWTLLVRFHPNMAETALAKKSFAADGKILNATSYPDMQELIVVSDVLVSDYSSVIYDFMISRKPVFIFAKDFDTYPQERNFKQLYFDLPYKICRTEDELFDSIKNFDSAKVEPAIKKFLDNVKSTDNGHASEAIVNKIQAVVENKPLKDSSKPTNLDVFNYVEQKYSDFLNELPVYKREDSPTPKIFWWCWLQGLKNAPPICKVCLKALARNYPDYKINIVTLKNISQFVSFPEHVVKKFNAGKISPTHFSDMLRLELLINHGGIWLDSCVLCTGRERDYLSEPLFVFKRTGMDLSAHLASSWFIVAQKAHPILKTTRDLLYKYWQEHDALGSGGFYFLFHCMFKLAAEKYPDEWAKVPDFPNVNPHLLQGEFFRPHDPDRFEQIKNLSKFHKLTWKYSAAQLSPEKTAGTNYEYLMKFFS